MVMLAKLHPAIHTEFMRGNFVVQKSARKFSLMAKDQAHEQSNKTLQAHGGAAGLYENNDALALFMLAGPDIARIVKEFEDGPRPTVVLPHHEEGHSFQLKNRKDILSFMTVVEQLGNPFLATNQELVALDTKIVMEQTVTTSLSEIREVGQTLHAEYVKSRLGNGASVPVSDTIKRNNMFTFANRPDPKKKSRKVSGVQRQNMTLLTQLFLSLQ